MRKLIIIITLACASILGLAFLPRASAAIQNSDLIKGPNSDAVYLISDNTKRVFPDAKTFLTWRSDFQDVKQVTVAELDVYPAGKPMAYRAGTKLVTHPNTARVYAVDDTDALHWIPTEQCAKDLYGADWAFRVQDVQESTFGSAYTVGVNSDCTHLTDGSLLQLPGSSTVYAVGGTSITPIKDDAVFDQANYQRQNIITVPSLNAYTVSLPVTDVPITNTPTSTPTSTLPTTNTTTPTGSSGSGGQSSPTPSTPSAPTTPTPPRSPDTITLPSHARGDFVDPGPIAAECQKHLDTYVKGTEYATKGYKSCTLTKSAVGMTAAECLNGYSPAGCTICVAECE
jgi:hypothetical protein